MVLNKAQAGVEKKHQALPQAAKNLEKIPVIFCINISSQDFKEIDVCAHGSTLYHVVTLWQNRF